MHLQKYCHEFMIIRTPIDLGKLGRDPMEILHVA
jgi:hypothetical protein